MIKTRNAMVRLPDARLAVAIADAQAAADAASRIAADAASWATQVKAGEDSAWDAACCAVRARNAATQSERCATASQAWACARLAWAAVSSGLEASSRVNAAIAERLAAL